MTSSSTSAQDEISISGWGWGWGGAFFRRFLSGRERAAWAANSVSTRSQRAVTG